MKSMSFNIHPWKYTKRFILLDKECDEITDIGEKWDEKDAFQNKKCHEHNVL